MAFNLVICSVLTSITYMLHPTLLRRRAIQRRGVLLVESTNRGSNLLTVGLPSGTLLESMRVKD